PQFGGAAAVWCGCLLFFQATLLAGYGLAFVLSRWPARTQGAAALLLFLAGALLTSIPAATADWMPRHPDVPVIDLLAILAANLLAPCALLSSVTVLLQQWRGAEAGSAVRRAAAGAPPADSYHLYGISNTGSLVALLAYPIAFDPVLTIGRSIA